MLYINGAGNTLLGIAAGVYVNGSGDNDAFYIKNGAYTYFDESTGSTGDVVLLETGDTILMETGDAILKE